MRAARCETQDRVAWLDIVPRQAPAPLDRADREAGEIVVAGTVVLGHLGGLAPDQRAASLTAALDDAFDHLARARRIELAGGEIVEEEQGLRAVHQQIVDAHRDEIDASDLVAAAARRQLQLGADAIGRRHQDGILEPGRGQIEEAARTP